MKGNRIGIIFAAILVAGIAWLFIRQHLGPEVLAQIDLPGEGRVVLAQEFDWGDRDGYWVNVWYQESPGELWGAVSVGPMFEDPWSEGELWLSPDSEKILVGDGSGTTWVFDLGLRATSYAGAGFIYDPDWQPGL